MITPEDEFEAALQAYERAVMEYRLAWKRYAEDVGQEAAQPKFREAMDRICALDSVPLIIITEAEVKERALRAVPVVDAVQGPDIYGGPIPQEVW